MAHGLGKGAALGKDGHQGGHNHNDYANCQSSIVPFRHSKSPFSRRFCRAEGGVWMAMDVPVSLVSS